jgi:hypothetical protein
MMRAKSGLPLIAAAILWAAPAPAQQFQIDNDYPTTAIADYVLGCMAANGETRQALERCACSIDVISTVLTYDEYVEAETVLSVGRMTGENAEMFRNTARMRDMVDRLRRAQAQADMECF